MINKQFFSLWVKDKINDLDRKIKQDYFNTVEEAYKAQGRLDLLKELYDSYNLEDVSTDDVEYLKNY